MIHSIIEILCVILGVVMLILAAMKNIWTFVVGMVQVALMSFVNYLNYEYVQALFHVVYLFPMQFLGYWMWRDKGVRLLGNPVLKRVGYIDHGGAMRLLVTGVLFFILFTPFVYGISVLLFNAGALEEILLTAIIMDSLLVTLNAIAQVMMTLGIIEQWYLWILVNILTLNMCFHALFDEGVTQHSMSQLAMNILYFIVSLAGLYIWKRSKKRRTVLW